MHRVAYSRAMHARVLNVRAVVTATLILGAAPAGAQQDFDDYFWSWRAVSGFDTSTGKYGQASDTTISFVPVMLQGARGPLTLKLSSGWLRVSGPALILDGAASAGAAAANRKVSGLADTSLSMMYSLEQFYDAGVYIDITGRVKLPSARYAKGLGTGEADAALQVDGAFSWGNVMPFATLGYKLNGRPEALALRDVAYGSLGLQYSWSERAASGVAYDYRQSALATSADPREGMAYTSYKFDNGWSINVYAVAGFSDNSPRAGGGVTLTYRLRPGRVSIR